MSAGGTPSKGGSSSDKDARLLSHPRRTTPGRVFRDPEHRSSTFFAFGLNWGENLGDDAAD